MNDAICSAWLGVDVSKAKFDVALLRQGKYKSRVFANDAAGFAQLLQWLDGHDARAVAVCMEATGSYFEALASFLSDQGLRVSVVNPLVVAAFAKTELSRGKTDAGDAKLIARYASERHPGPWQPPTREVRTLRDLVRRLEALHDLRTQESNRLGVAGEAVRASIQAVLDTLNAQIEAVRRQIQDHIDRHPDLRDRARLLDSIPGIGPATIATLLAEIDFDAFTSARAAAAFCGLTPRPMESGTSLKRPTRLSKIGSARLRRALYMPAMVACTHNPVIKAFYLRLQSNGCTPKQAVCAAMRKLVHLAFGVLKSGKPFDQSLHLASA